MSETKETVTVYSLADAPPPSPDEFEVCGACDSVIRVSDVVCPHCGHDYGAPLPGVP